MSAGTTHSLCGGLFEEGYGADAVCSDCWEIFMSEEEGPAHDPVVNPSHYNNHPSGVECIDIVKHFNFCRGNAIKYIWRAGQKGDEIQDLRKAIQNLQIEIARLEAS